jgi:TolB-like protein
MALAADSAVLAAIAREARIDPEGFPSNSVAVLPLTVVTFDPGLASLGYGLAELLMTDLSRSSQIQVVERPRIRALLRELELVQGGLSDSERGPRAGKLLGARHLVHGSLFANDQERVQVEVNLTKTLDATVRPVVVGGTSLDDVLEAEKELAFRVCDALGVTLTPSERAAILQQPTRNLGALLAFSRGIEAETELRFFDALREYGEALRLDPAFREPRDRLFNLGSQTPTFSGVANLAIDAINRPEIPSISDVVEPAFPARQWAILIIPITIR